MMTEYDVWYWDVMNRNRVSTTIVAKSYGDARQTLNRKLNKEGITASQIEIEENIANKK